MTQEEAEAALREAGYVPDVVESGDTTEPAGTVIQQSPPAGQEAPEGSTVTIVVSTYEEEPTESPSPTDTGSPTPTLPTESPS
jgi:serine/threonine-protein kinase